MSNFEPESFVYFADIAAAADDLRPVRTVAAHVPITAEAFERNAVAVRMEDLWDPIRRPWAYPNRNPFPKLDWWPWIDRWRAAPGEARMRLAAALDILRHGEPDREDDY